MKGLSEKALALHNPVRSLSPRERERHQRTISVIGEEGQARLLAARVLVVGAGGLASPVLSYLAGMGVGHIGLCDADVVETGNLPRQIIHNEAALGMPKTSSARRSIEALNSDVDVAEYGWAMPNLLDQVAGSYDIVLDCSDTFESKYTVADWCVGSGHPLVWAVVAATTWQVSTFWSASPNKPTTLRDLHAAPPPPGAVPTPAAMGVVGPAVGVCGSLMAGEAMKLLTGCGSPLIGRVAVGDVKFSDFKVWRFL